jgi:D-alanyl-D-alanine dipeptidase
LYYARAVIRRLALVMVLCGVARADRDDDFVDVAKVIPDAVLDIRYATTNNFMHEKVYPVARCKLRRAVAAKLVEAAKLLREQERRLILWDCYRPASVQKILWKHQPDPRYVADPKVGSVHSRGAAVDIGIVDKDGKPVTLPTEYDAAGRDSHRDRALAGDKGAEARRLEAAMVKAGFVGLATEWWHFDFKDAAKYSLADEPL